MTEKAMRFNEGKPQLSMVLSARYALEGCAKVLEVGAQKYDRDNWKKGMDKEAILDSMLRHVTKLLNGEKHDDETGLPHVDHILCNALFLSYHHNGRKDQERYDNDFRMETFAPLEKEDKKGEWKDNPGYQPVPDDTRVEVMFRSGQTDAENCAGYWIWNLNEIENYYDIIKWRYLNE